MSNTTHTQCYIATVYTTYGFKAYFNASRTSCLQHTLASLRVHLRLIKGQICMQKSLFRNHTSLAHINAISLAQNCTAHHSSGASSHVSMSVAPHMSCQAQPTVLHLCFCSFTRYPLVCLPGLSPPAQHPLLQPSAHCRPL